MYFKYDERRGYYVVMRNFVFNVSEKIDECSGTKAIELAKLKNMGINVPRFWAVNYDEYERFTTAFSIISVENFLNCPDYDPSIENVINSLNSCLTTTLVIDPNVKLIARSSSLPTEEHNNYASMISGAFESYECNCTTLAKSIASVYASLYSEKSFYQLKLAKLESGIKGMAVLVQEYIEPECSGVLHVFLDKPYMELNWVKGHLRSIVSGNTSGDYDQMYEENGEIIVKGKEQHIYCIMENNFHYAFTELFREAKIIQAYKATDLEIEWLYRDKKIYIVQCQELIDI